MLDDKHSLVKNCRMIFSRTESYNDAEKEILTVLKNHKATLMDARWIFNRVLVKIEEENVITVK